MELEFRMHGFHPTLVYMEMKWLIGTKEALPFERVNFLVIPGYFYKFQPEFSLKVSFSDKK